MILSETQHQSVQELIAELDQLTTGQLQLYIDDYCKGDAWYKGVKLVKELGLLNHPRRNTALVYIARKDQKLSLITDDALHQCLDAHFVEECLQLMQDHFKKHEFEEGLKTGIRQIMQAQIDHFPVNSISENQQ